MKKKIHLFVLFLGCFFTLTQSQLVFAAPEPDANKIVIREPTTDVDVLYDTYKENSFELLTKEYKGSGKIKNAFVNSSAMLKNLTWGLVKGLGQFNAEMVTFLFSMDVVKPIKQPIQQLTANIAGNMLSVAGSVGIGFVTLIMGLKFIGEQRFRKALRVFGMTILIFTGLAVCKDANTADSLFNTMFDADKQIEAAFVKVNPVLGGESVPNTKKVPSPTGIGPEQQVELSADDRMKSAGELIASRVFYTNVYEPYLLLNYGTSNPETIRKKTVTYKNEEYDRINLLLDNDLNTKENEELYEKVTDYEAEELNNHAVMYYSNVGNTFFGCFCFVVNLIQTLVYFVLCFVRLVIAVMQILLLPLLPILLLVGLFMTGMNVFANYFKAFGMTIFMKAMTGFACIFFATFLSLGFQLSNAVDNPWQKILTILIYLLTPLGLYVFRKFLGSLFTGRVSLADAVGFAAHPFSTEKKMRDAAKEKKAANKEHRKQAKEERKAALKKRQEAAEKRGKQDLGMKQKPGREREGKRSALRRELQPKAQHKAPNVVEKTQQKWQETHEKRQQHAANEDQQLARQRQRKAFDKENLQTAAALSGINHAQKQAGTGEAKKDATPQQLRQHTRRTGQSSKGREHAPSTNGRRQGQRQTPPTADTPKAETKQRQSTGKRSTARSHHRTSGQTGTPATITPKAHSQARLRAQGGSNGSPLRQSAPVRQKRRPFNRSFSGKHHRLFQP